MPPAAEQLARSGVCDWPKMAEQLAADGVLNMPPAADEHAADGVTNIKRIHVPSKVQSFSKLPSSLCDDKDKPALSAFGVLWLPQPLDSLWTAVVATAFGFWTAV